MMTIGRRRGFRGATIAAVGVLAAGCTNAPGFQTLTIGEALASMLAFFIAFAAFWIFIWIFVDVFRRDDISGVAKAGWVLALVILPLLGSLIYIGVRPKRPLTTSFSREPESTKEMSSAEQFAELDRLRAAGKITDAEYEQYVRDAKR